MFEVTLKVIRLISFLNPNIFATKWMCIRYNSSIGRELSSVSLVIHLTSVRGISIDLKTHTHTYIILLFYFFLHLFFLAASGLSCGVWDLL